MSTTERPYTIRTAAQTCGVSYMHLWRLVHRGEIPHVRLGNKILIPAHFVQAVLEGKPITKPADLTEQHT